MLRDPHHNKGLAFTEKERDAHYLRGLLPPAVLSQDLQVSTISPGKNKKKNKINIRVTYFSHSFKFRYVDSGLQEKKMMHNIRQYDVPLHKYMAMMDLQVN